LEKFVHELNALWKLSGSSMGALRELVTVAGIEKQVAKPSEYYGFATPRKHTRVS
jgi:hypothetical protein